ncbi:MAG: serine/threonine-protein kinase [Nocardioidaceae bacterium]
MAISRRARPVAGRYLLVDEIARGGMSAVWRAWDLRERRYVAAKVLLPEHGSLLLRFVQEQAIRVDHPHVVMPRAWAAEDGRVLFAMELVRGGTVETLLREHGRGLPSALVAELLGQLLEALAAVHAAGVVHRDVKPGNLLLEATGRGRPHLRLADFGVATLVDGPRLTRAPGQVGTEGYVAPELAAGASPVPGQDLFSAGVVAAVLLTGRGAAEALAVLPEGPLEDLVRRLADPDPARRPAGACAARDLLAATGHAAAWPGLVVPDRLGPDPPRRRDWVPIAAACCVALALLLAGAAAGLAWG